MRGIVWPVAVELVGCDTWWGFPSESAPVDTEGKDAASHQCLGIRTAMNIVSIEIYQSVFYMKTKLCVKGKDVY